MNLFPGGSFLPCPPLGLGRLHCLTLDYPEMQCADGWMGEEKFVGPRKF